MKIRKVFMALIVTSIAMAFVSCGKTVDESSLRSDSDTKNSDISGKMLRVWDSGDISIEERISFLNAVVDDSVTYKIISESDETITLARINLHGCQEIVLYEDSLEFLDENMTICCAYGEEDDVGELAANKLSHLMEGVDVSQDAYTNWVYEATGENLTNYDLTSNINVSSASMHHVTSVNGVTVIFLEFPSSGVSNEMYNYYVDLNNMGNNNSPDMYSPYDYRDADFGLVSSGENHMFYIVGNDFISIACGFENDSEPVDSVTDAFGYPNIAELRALMILIN